MTDDHLILMFSGNLSMAFGVKSHHSQIDIRSELMRLSYTFRSVLFLDEFPKILVGRIKIIPFFQKKEGAGAECFRRN